MMKKYYPIYLPIYDWLHLHHEDFTGQYGKFYFHLKMQLGIRKEKEMLKN